MATLEMVEKLKEKTNATYDEAKAALEACNDDLLDALIYLERQGKATPPQNGGQYSSKQEAPAKEAKTYYNSEDTVKGESFGQLFHRFWNWFRNLVRRSNKNHFDVWRKEEKILSMPVTVLIILLIPFFSIILPALVIGLFFGFHYRFRGPDLGKDSVNKVMDSAANAAENFKQEVIHGDHNKDENVK